MRRVSSQELQTYVTRAKKASKGNFPELRNNFRGCNLRNFTFSHVFFNEASFASGRLQNIVFTQCEFNDVNFAETTFVDCLFSVCEFVSCNFERSKGEATFDVPHMSGVNFGAADLRKFTFTGGTIQGVRMFVPARADGVFFKENTQFGAVLWREGHGFAAQTMLCLCGFVKPLRAWLALPPDTKAFHYNADAIAWARDCAGTTFVD